MAGLLPCHLVMYTCHCLLTWLWAARIILTMLWPTGFLYEEKLTICLKVVLFSQFTLFHWSFPTTIKGSVQHIMYLETPKRATLCYCDEWPLVSLSSSTDTLEIIVYMHVPISGTKWHWFWTGLLPVGTLYLYLTLCATGGGTLPHIFTSLSFIS